MNVRKATHWIRCFGLVVSDGPDRYNKICTHGNAFVCRLGCPEFTWPVDRPTPKTGSSRSLFIPESAIYNGHPRFATLTRNIRQRRGERVTINIPSKYFNFLKKFSLNKISRLCCVRIKRELYEQLFVNYSNTISDTKTILFRIFVYYLLDRICGERTFWS